ncbi:ABC transporter permease [Thiofilum flexile]|uniref:ABC transporter permease n=1 Tax=Thiofilum flexile TaxID=125627 RepID=UPI00036479F1|nr:FtsX-like permease family protein [Thiofilum flexile]
MNLSYHWTLWLRRWRLSEMRLLLIAMIVSVAVVTAVGFFTDRVGEAMRSQAVELMGGDLVLTSTRPLSEDFIKQAEQQGLSTAQMLKFNSMASTADAMQLVEVKAVSGAYPLKGEVRLAKALGQPYTLATTLPKAGEVWAEPALMNMLQLKIGDQIELGNSLFTISELLIQEPDRGTSFLQISPVILMNAADVPATGLVTIASRARYNHYYAGNSRSIESLQAWLKPQLKSTEQVRTLEDGLPSVQESLQRAMRFLGLSSLLSVVLAATAIALTSASLVRKETVAVAVSKAMGQSRRNLMREQFISLLVLALLAALVGSAIGYGLQFLLADRLAEVIHETLPLPSWRPVWLGFLTAVILLLGFALPYIWQLLNTEPIQILQQRFNTIRVPLKGWLIALVPALYGLFWLQAQDPLLALWILGGLVVGLGVFWLAALGLVRLVSYLSWHFSWRWLAVFRGARRSVLLLVVFATGFFSLLLLTTIRTDLVNRWEESLPANAPNQFLINIQPQDQPGLVKALQERQFEGKLYPMIRGRLIAVNGKEITQEQFENPEAKQLLNREFNLSSFSELPASNTVLQGTWFSADTKDGFSIEQGVGKTLGFGLGDRLTFDIAGQRFEQAVTSVREVKWDSLQPNFFVVAAPQLLKDLPHTYITSIHVPKDNQNLLQQVIQQYPSITAIDVSAIMEQIRALINRATFAVQGIFLFTLVAGVVVLIAALQSQRSERQREIAILKSMGASHTELKQRISIEFMVIGALAGLLAGLIASVLGSIIALQLFDLVGAFNPLPPLLGAITGMVLVGLAGFWSLRGLLNVPPMLLLKG